MKAYYVYIMTNKKNGTIYIGLTNSLKRRAFEHRNGMVDGFTKKYNLTRLVYFEDTNDIHSAIAHEKNLKNWRRAWKIELIEKNNPTWQDLSDDW